MTALKIHHKVLLFCITILSTTVPCRASSLEKNSYSRGASCPSKDSLSLEELLLIAKNRSQNLSSDPVRKYFKHVDPESISGQPTGPKYDSVLFFDSVNTSINKISIGLAGMRKQNRCPKAGLVYAITFLTETIQRMEAILPALLSMQLEHHLPASVPETRDAWLFYKRTLNYEINLALSFIDINKKKPNYSDSVAHWRTNIYFQIGKLFNEFTGQNGGWIKTLLEILSDHGRKKRELFAEEGFSAAKERRQTIAFLRQYLDNQHTHFVKSIMFSLQGGGIPRRWASQEELLRFATLAIEDTFYLENKGRYLDFLIDISNVINLYDEIYSLKTYGSGRSADIAEKLLAGLTSRINSLSGLLPSYKDDLQKATIGLANIQTWLDSTETKSTFEELEKSLKEQSSSRWLKPILAAVTAAVLARIAGRLAVVGVNRLFPTVSPGLLRLAGAATGIFAFTGASHLGNRFIVGQRGGSFGKELMTNTAIGVFMLVSLAQYERSLLILGRLPTAAGRAIVGLASLQLSSVVIHRAETGRFPSANKFTNLLIQNALMSIAFEVGHFLSKPLESRLNVFLFEKFQRSFQKELQEILILRRDYIEQWSKAPEKVPPNLIQDLFVKEHRLIGRALNPSNGFTAQERNILRNVLADYSLIIERAKLQIAHLGILHDGVAKTDFWPTEHQHVIGFKDSHFEILKEYYNRSHGTLTALRGRLYLGEIIHEGVPVERVFYVKSAVPPAPQVTILVPGLFEAMTPNMYIEGWQMKDLKVPPERMNRAINSPWTSIQTLFTSPKQITGSIVVSYNPEAAAFELNDIFFHDRQMPSWIETTPALVPPKGTPTAVLFALRSMQSIGVKYSSLRAMRIHGLINIRTILELNEALDANLPLSEAILFTQAYRHALTLATQSGHQIIDVSVEKGTEEPLGNFMQRFEKNPPGGTNPDEWIDRHERLLKEFLIDRKARVLGNFDIVLRLAPIK